MAPHAHELRVRYSECDPQGIVFNAHYVAWMDVAFTELWRTAFGPWTTLTDRGVDAVVAEVGVRFRAPARFDDVVALEMGVAELGTTSMSSTVDVRRDGELLAEGRIRHVFVDAATWAKTPVPDWVRDGLGRFLVA